MKNADSFLKKVLITAAATLLIALIFQPSTWAKGKPPWASGPKIAVMTRNLYVGADITSLADAGNPAEFIAGVEAALGEAENNDFTERAVSLAAEIVEKNPDLVGLQEVYRLTSSIDSLNGFPPFLDYQALLLDALDAQGACYDVVATVTNLDISQIPTTLYGYVSATDRDVILARCDVEASPVDLKSTCLRPSEVEFDDGCTYSVTASKVIPGGGGFPDITIEFKRGYVGVDANIGDLSVRLFNTHLEIRYPDPTNPFSSFVQAAQAEELIYVIHSLQPLQNGPVIITGDINSSPEDVPIFPWMPPYVQFTEPLDPDLRFYDAWTLRPGKPKGFTCCYDEDLFLPADLYERIDMIFTNLLPSRVKANVVGNDEADQTPSGLWPSDHAGVAARLWYE